jgi:hypothetical protein
MTALARRIVRFLQKADDWVSKKELCTRARAKGYGYDAVCNALSEVQEHIECGTKSEQGMWYRWYDMSDEERLKYIGWRNAFDELGD